MFSIRQAGFFCLAERPGPMWRLQRQTHKPNTQTSKNILVKHLTLKRPYKYSVKSKILLQALLKEVWGYAVGFHGFCFRTPIIILIIGAANHPPLIFRSTHVHRLSPPEP